jgi:serine/threonine protein kinase
MWSLGCVYLEILVWFVDGYPALLKFRESREGHVQPNGLEDEGFYHETASGKVELRKPVMDMIEYLRKCCNGGLKDIAETIPLLLRIDPKKRPSATQLVDTLGHLGASTSTKNSSSLLTRPAYNATLPVRGSISSRARGHGFESDSDSDFGGMIKVTRPSDG